MCIRLPKRVSLITDEINSATRKFAPRLGKRPFGAIALFALADQKNDFSSTDLELFRLLETHAAVALRASGLEAAAER